jgi:hypothetical protein
MQNLEFIRDKTITRGFPEFGGRSIPVKWANMKRGYFESDLTIGDFSMKVDRSLRKAPEGVIMGGMSHELSHMAIEYGSNVFQRVIDTILLDWSERYQTWDERRTDILAVERGLGRELLEFVMYADRKRNNPYKTKDGLTAGEIRQMLKARGE